MQKVKDLGSLTFLNLLNSMLDYLIVLFFSMLFNLMISVVASMIEYTVNNFYYINICKRIIYNLIY